MTQKFDIESNATCEMKQGNFEAALELFHGLDLARLDPLSAVRILKQMSRCADALGRVDESAEYCRQGLSLLSAHNLLLPETMPPDVARLALDLSVGAYDTAGVKKYMKMFLGGLSYLKGEFKISRMADAATWCAARNIGISVLDPLQHIDLHLTTEEDIRYVCQPTWYATIPEAEIVSGWDYVLTPDGMVLTGANYAPIYNTYAFMPHAFNESLNLVAHVWPPECTNIDADALFLSTPERHHYGHWLAEFLPRLRAWDRHENHRRKIVIPSQLPHKHREMLTYFGVTSEDIIPCDLGRRYKFRSLRVVNAGAANAPNPQSAAFLYAALGPARTPNPRKPGRDRFFLVRDAGTRMPANQNELDAVLKEFGVTRLNPAKLGFAEQQALFANAGVIIGAFGTELYCLFNLRPGSTVIELVWEANKSRVYGPICSYLEINHRLIVCEVAEKNAASNYKIDRDLIIDCAQLRRHLQACDTQG